MRPDLFRPSRHAAFVLCILLLGLSLWLAGHHPHGWRPFAWAGVGLFGILCLIGVHDLVQRSHAILRNYPVIGHVRWLAELVRPEIRQYLLEADEEAAPFS